MKTIVPNRLEDLPPLPSGRQYVQCACGCGVWFDPLPHKKIKRPKRFVAGHNGRLDVLEGRIITGRTQA